MGEKVFVAILLCMIQGAPAAPGKSTIAASEPLHSLVFVLKYLPVTVAEDNHLGDSGDGQVQGRVQVLQSGSYTERNCQLFWNLGELSAADKSTSMTQNGVGKACSYSTDKKYASGSELHKVFAYNQVQCCNACVATENCAGATFLTSDNDHSGGFGPQSWEGFGIHMTDVTTSKTDGGITVDKLEENYRDRLRDLSAFDQFMDFSITFFTYNLQPYYDAFSKDKVPFLLAQWEDIAEKESWYSLIFLVNRSHHIIELVSHEKPAGSSSTLPRLEQRMSPEHCANFKQSPSDPVHLLNIASINRAASNISLIDSVYTQLMKTTPTYQIDERDLVRRCYNMSSSSAAVVTFPPPGGNALDIDVCFTSRAPDPEKDKIFSVVDFEQMLWSAHAATTGSNPSSMVDKYTDNHYAMPFPQSGLDALASYFAEHSTYPITKEERLSYACKQNYIIDPTGWSIQPIGMANWPNCHSLENVMV